MVTDLRSIATLLKTLEYIRDEDAVTSPQPNIIMVELLAHIAISLDILVRDTVGDIRLELTEDGDIRSQVAGDGPETDNTTTSIPPQNS